jgi:methionyl-tRNA synthetase
MPETSKEIFKQLNYEPRTFKELHKKIENHKINMAKPLFSKIEDSLIEGLRVKYSGKQEQPTEKKPNLEALKKTRV